MTSFNKNNMDFIATLSGSSFKAQWFHFFSSGLEEKYVSQFDYDPNSPIPPVDFVKPNRYLNATGSCIDPAGNIFIADSGKSRVFKFNSSGGELQSFGDSTVFRPRAVAYFDRVLFVLDSKKNQILRFKLSTDL